MKYLKGRLSETVAHTNVISHFTDSNNGFYIRCGILACYEGLRPTLSNLFAIYSPIIANGHMPWDTRKGTYQRQISMLNWMLGDFRSRFPCHSLFTTTEILSSENCSRRHLWASSLVYRFYEVSVPDHADFKEFYTFSPARRLLKLTHLEHFEIAMTYCSSNSRKNVKVNSCQNY